MAKKILKVTVWVISIILILLLIGYVLDIALYPTFKNNAKKALAELEKFKINEEQNAWGIYQTALDSLTENTMMINTAFRDYSAGKTALTRELSAEIDKADKFLQKVREGTKLSRCHIPLNYDKGWDMDLPPYTKIQRLQTMLAAHARRAFENQDLEQGMADIQCGLTFSQHMLSAAPILIQYMVGIVLVTKILEPAIDACSKGLLKKPQLERMEALLSRYENEMPYLARALETETYSLKIALATFPVFVPLEFKIGPYLGSSSSFAFIRIALPHFIFSPRMAILKAFDFMKTTGTEIERIEKGEIGKTPEERQASADRLDKYVKANPLASLFMPNNYAMVSRKIRMVSRLRMLNAACQVQRYCRINNRFPDALDKISKHSSIDPLTGQSWKYEAAAESAVIASLGMDGVYSTNDDFKMVLRK